MKELIIRSVQDDSMLVSARELHKKLEISTDFRHWFPRMCKYGFEEGLDFNKVIFDRVQSEGKRKVKREISDYTISMDMAKEICMLTRSEKGKEVRLYFLKIEKAWNNPKCVMSRALQMANRNLLEFQQQYGLLETQCLEQQKQIIVLTEKSTYLDLILQSPDVAVVTQIAKDYGYSAVIFNQMLHRMRIQYKVHGQWVLYSEYQGKGYTQSKTIVIRHINGIVSTKMYTVWTQKGRRFLYEKLKKQGILPLIERSD